jgi:hypothetical protein
VDTDTVDAAGYAILRTIKLLKTDFIQSFENVKSPFYISVFLEILVHLDFLLNIASHVKQPVEFTDDIVPHTGKYPYDNITSLVQFFRDAAVHYESHPRRKTRNNPDGVRMKAWQFQSGGGQRSSNLGKYLCQYEDDICLIMGDHLIYLHRHIIRTYNEVTEKLLSMKEFHTYKELVDMLAKDG